MYFLMERRREELAENLQSEKVGSSDVFITFLIPETKCQSSRRRGILAQSVEVSVDGWLAPRQAV